MTFLQNQSEPVAAHVSIRVTAPEPAAITPTQWLCLLELKTPKAAGSESVYITSNIISDVTTQSRCVGLWYLPMTRMGRDQ